MYLYSHKEWNPCITWQSFLRERIFVPVVETTLFSGLRRSSAHQNSGWSKSEIFLRLLHWFVYYSHCSNKWSYANIGGFRELARHICGWIGKDEKELQSGEESFERRTFPTGSTSAEKTWRMLVATSAQLGHVADSMGQDVSKICDSY
jgi:hypothetical protein